MPNVPNPLALKKMKQSSITMRFSVVGTRILASRVTGGVGVVVGSGVKANCSCASSAVGVAVTTT